MYAWSQSLRQGFLWGFVLHLPFTKCLRVAGYTQGQQAGAGRLLCPAGLQVNLAEPRHRQSCPAARGYLSVLLWAQEQAHVCASAISEQGWHCYEPLLPWPGEELPGALTFWAVLCPGLQAVLPCANTWPSQFTDYSWDQCCAAAGLGFQSLLTSTCVCWCVLERKDKGIVQNCEAICTTSPSQREHRWKISLDLWGFLEKCLGFICYLPLPLWSPLRFIALKREKGNYQSAHLLSVWRRCAV